MKPIQFKEYKVKVNENHTATIHCALKPNSSYVCLFNKEEHKDFINGYKALGFSVAITQLGNYQEHFFPILFTNETELTEILMKKIWDEIKKEGLPE